MRVGLIILLVGVGLLTSGCYVMEYNYDPYYDGYYDGPSYPSRSTVRYYSPIEPLVDLAILGAVLYGWHHWTPRYHHAPAPRFRVRR